MKIKSRTLYLKKGKKVGIHTLRTNRRFFARIRGYPGERARVIVKYLDEKKEWDGVPYNDSGYYTNRAELVRTAKAFIDQ